MTWNTARVGCLDCGHRFKASYPPESAPDILECPECHSSNCGVDKTDANTVPGQDAGGVQYRIPYQGVKGFHPQEDARVIEAWQSILTDSPVL